MKENLHFQAKVERFLTKNGLFFTQKIPLYTTKQIVRQINYKTNKTHETKSLLDNKTFKEIMREKKLRGNTERYRNCLKFESAKKKKKKKSG